MFKKATSIQDFMKIDILIILITLEEVWLL